MSYNNINNTNNSNNNTSSSNNNAYIDVCQDSCVLCLCITDAKSSTFAAIVK